MNQISSMLVLVVEKFAEFPTRKRSEALEYVIGTLSMLILIMVMSLHELSTYCLRHFLHGLVEHVEVHGIVDVLEPSKSVRFHRHHRLFEWRRNCRGQSEWLLMNPIVTNSYDVTDYTNSSGYKTILT